MQIHFEIGTTRGHTWGNTDPEETFSVFSADSLSECLVEFKKQKYDIKTHFIDIWETDNRGTSIPVGVVDLKRMCL